MGLSREIAKVLKPNEFARLRCHEACEFSSKCLGVEAKQLVQLQLMILENKTFDSLTLGKEFFLHLCTKKANPLFRSCGNRTRMVSLRPKADLEVNFHSAVQRRVLKRLFRSLQVQIIRKYRVLFYCHLECPS